MTALYNFSFNNSETERFFDDLTLGLLYALNDVMGVENVMAVVSEGLVLEKISEWERVMEFPLPQDLINFYSLLNGLHISWGYKMRNNALLKVGLLKVESLYELKPIGYIRNPGDSNFATLDAISDEGEPKFDTNFKYFYFMVKHAGLPQWQLGQTSLGMAMWAKQLMYTFTLCLQSPPTSGLHAWLVDQTRAKESYRAALADPTIIKFNRSMSIEYAGYFSIEIPATSKIDSPGPEDTSFEDSKATEGTLTNLENLSQDATTENESTYQESSTSQERSNSQHADLSNSSPLESSEKSSGSSGSDDQTFTTT